MNAAILSLMCLTISAGEVQADTQTKTRLYVRTVPSGATILTEGKPLGKSDGLFVVPPGTREITVELAGYSPQRQKIDVAEGKITRMEVELKRQAAAETTAAEPGKQSLPPVDPTARPAKEPVVLSYVDDTAESQRSFADAGHAVQFERPKDVKSVVAVELFGARYGHPQPPDEEFHIYLLDQDQKVIRDVAVAYARVSRGDLKWYRFEIPATAVPEKFFVAVWFNAEATKGVYVGMDKNVKESHSFAGLPEEGFQKVPETYDWMIRATLDDSTPSVEKTSRRTWTDATGAFTIEAELIGVSDGKARLKRADGKIVEVPVERLSQADQGYLKGPDEKAAPKEPEEKAASEGSKEAKELAHDDGKMADKRSIAGGGHAVAFQAEGDSCYVTAVRLHGSRYGMPQPPKESFRVWICDEKFQPIANFQFPYSSYTRGQPKWGTFPVKPTKVSGKFYVCFAFNPEATKGVYVSYDAQGTGNSFVGVPGERGLAPFNSGDWLIRCKIENRTTPGPAPAAKAAE